MVDELITIKGIYHDGQISPLSNFLPKGEYQVLITFLDPISGQLASYGPDSLIDGCEFRTAQLGITKREYAVLELVKLGFTNQEISEKLKIKEGTVRNYVSALLRKMEAANRTMLVKLAIERKILPGKQP